MSDTLTIDSVFPIQVCTIEKPEFLEDAIAVTSDYLDSVKEQKQLNDIYPVYMTDNLNYDPRILDFANYVAQTAWNILQDQGYAVQDLITNFESMWCQEHYKHSLMEQHVHGNGAQIVGFYFIDVPEGSSRVLFHDPKAGKVQANLMEENISNRTPSSNIINYEAKEGLLILTNSWLPHSFTRHTSDKPLRFIHFNITVSPAHIASPVQSNVEII